MDILAGLRIAIDTFWYNLILSLAGLHWSLLRGLVMMGYTIELINNWLRDNAFAPLIDQTNASLRVAVSAVFVIALLVLGLTYLLAAFIRLEVVQFRSALTWYIAGALFFTLGPSLYQGMNDFRITVAQGFYLSTLQGLQDTFGATFGSLDQVESTDLALGPLCDYLGVYLPDATGPGGIDGLDVALAYLRADGPDVMGYAQPVYSPGCPAHPLHPLTGAYISPVPQEWYFDGSYFDIVQSPYYFDELDDEARAASIALASSSHGRMITAWPLVLFGVSEQLVYLLITIAMGLTFISFSMAILFAFFKKTEVIARAIVDQWIELIVQTVVIALVQALVVAFFLAGTASGNSMVTLGIGLICLIFMVIVLWSGIKAVWNALNRLFNAMGQVTGGVVVAPGTAALATAGAAGGVASVGSSALAGMAALNQGATMAQATGITFGGSSALTGAARSLAHLPGTRHTPLGEAAEQFLEGSSTRQVAGGLPMIGGITGPLVGAALLSDRDPLYAAHPPMLIPAIGHLLDDWTVPKRSKRGNEPDDEPEDRPTRMGWFTPSRSLSNGSDAQHQREQSDHVHEQVSEELEQHISDSLSVHAKTGSGASLEAAADALQRAAQAQSMLGQLKVTGVGTVAGVMGDVVGQVQQGQPAHQGINHVQTAQQMAQVMGVTPQTEAGSPIQRDLARFGLFLDQVLKLGLTPQQTEQIVREVQTSPDGKLKPETRDLLDNQLQSTQNFSWVRARDEVNHLEHTARMLPNEITAFGAMTVPTPQIQVDPRITVNVPPVKPNSDYDAALHSASLMEGS